jgi:hypothetical protein
MEYPYVLHTRASRRFMRESGSHHGVVTAWMPIMSPGLPERVLFDLVLPVRTSIRTILP